MARRGLKYIATRMNQILFLTLSLAFFTGLCFVSLSEAKNEYPRPKWTQKQKAAAPIGIMQALLTQQTTDNCIIPEQLPAAEKCRPFFNIDEGSLQNLLNNYTECLEDQPYYINFSNQPVIKLTNTLYVFGTSDDPLTVRGLKLAPGKDFPKGKPPIVIHGNAVKLEEIQLEGFETGIKDCEE